MFLRLEGQAIYCDVWFQLLTWRLELFVRGEILSEERSVKTNLLHNFLSKQVETDMSKAINSDVE